MQKTNQETGSHVRPEADEALTRKWQKGQPAIVWSVAGYDPSSGAGITADLQTFAAHGMFGCSAITALTVQNTVDVFGSAPVEVPVLDQTLLRLGEDLPPAGIKLGMLATAEIARVIATCLAQLRRSLAGPPIVIFDPVLRSSSGRELYPAGGIAALHAELLPQVDWLTPNWAELEVLSGLPVGSPQACEAAMHAVAARHPHLHLVATGGDQDEAGDLLLTPGGPLRRFAGKRVTTTSTHGTGCAFSSALLCELVRGAEAAVAVERAKQFVEGALRFAPGLGSGRGPMDLLWPLRLPVDR